MEGVSAGWEKSPNNEFTNGAVDVGAYEVCEVSSGGRLEGSLESDILSYTPVGMGSAAACLSGLKVDMLEWRFGRWSESCGAWGVAWPGSLPVGVCPSACSSTTSRTNPSTRRTIFPTTTSLGWAEVNRLPTCLMRSTSFAASRPLNSPTTRNNKAVVAIAHGLEFRICRRLRSL